jgi:hypothetical protein
VGGQPGYSGKIFLDAPSSALAPHGGAIADVQPGSYVATPYGTFSIMNSGVQEAFAGWGFIWDQTQINLLSLYLDPASPMILPGYSAPAVASANANTFDLQDSIKVGAVQNGGYLTLSSYADFSGHWLAVPEPATVWLLVLGIGALLGGCRMGRRS